MSKKKRVFSTAPLTAPTAGETIPGTTHEHNTPPKNETSRALEAQTSRPLDVTPTPDSKQRRVSYTWRITPQHADTLTGLTTQMREIAEKTRLDRADMLTALTTYAAHNPEILRNAARHLPNTP